MKQLPSRLLQILAISTCLFPLAVQAQVTPDDTLPDNTVLTPDGKTIKIDGGTTRGNNLFHSFQEFSVPANRTADFNNADNIDNILSRVTGGAESVINGGISANGSANLFLINPAGIIFGENASLDVGGSFIGSTADNLLFPSDVEYSATDTDTAPVLTINAPIGLGFRDNPQPITNASRFDIDNFTGLSVPENATLALIGGDIFLEGGFVTTPGGRIELGSVGENSTVSLREVAQGWDVGYSGVENFQDLNLTGQAFVGSSGADTGDIQVRASKTSLLEGSEIAIDTAEGKAGNLNVVATDSLTISGNSSEVDFEAFESGIFINVSDSATAANSTLRVTTNKLTLDNGGLISARTLGSGQGADIEIAADEISIGEPFVFAVDDFIGSGIFAQTDVDSTGDGGSINLETTRLNINGGGQVSAGAFGAGDGGNLVVNATESIELTGTIAASDSTLVIPSALFSNVENVASATGNAGDTTINTSRLKVSEGAQIGSLARNLGNGGTLTINADESIVLNGFAPQAEFRGDGISAILIGSEPSFEDESGNVIASTGDPGNINLTTGDLVIEDGAAISSSTFSLGDSGDINLDVNRLIVRNGGEVRAGSFIGANPLDTQRGAGGTININAQEIEVTGSGDINGERVKSSLLAVGESNGSAGSIQVNSSNLRVSDGGEISAATFAGTGGNIDLQIDENIRLNNDSLISAAATEDADGGNIALDTTFIIAGPDGNNDIVASAGEQGTGGNIRLDAESVFGLEVRPQNVQTNDLDTSGGVDGQVIINTPDTDIRQPILETPANLVEQEKAVAQVCRNDGSGMASNNLVVNGKGGVPPLTSEPLNSERLVVDGQGSNNQEPQADQASAMEPLQTAAGEITPARGLIKTASGKIILTAYPTENNQRIPQGKVNCGS